MRLSEKATQLTRYADQVTTLASDASGKAKTALNTLAKRLTPAAKLTASEADIFAQDLTDPDTLVSAANAFCQPPPRCSFVPLRTSIFSTYVGIPRFFENEFWCPVSISCQLSML